MVCVVCVRAQVGKAAGVPLVYGLVEMALIPIFGLAAWKAGMTYAGADEPVRYLCTAMALMCSSWITANDCLLTVSITR